MQRETPVELLRSHVSQHCEAQGPLANAAVDDVHVLVDVREPVISRERVYIPFSSKGMLASVRNGRSQCLKMVLDGKQKVLNNQWAILTIGFIVRRQDLGSTSSRKKSGERIKLMAHTSTMQPFMQAIIDQESTENIADALEDTAKLCAQIAQIDLKQWLMQMHKDYAKGIEAARKKKFPNVRALEDFFHMIEKVQNTLQKKLQKQKKTAEESKDPPVLLLAICGDRELAIAS